MSVKVGINGFGRIGKLAFQAALGKEEELLIYDIADALELSHDELLNKKDMQKKALNSIRRLEM